MWPLTVRLVTMISENITISKKYHALATISYFHACMSVKNLRLLLDKDRIVVRQKMSFTRFEICKNYILMYASTCGCQPVCCRVFSTSGVFCIFCFFLEVVLCKYQITVTMFALDYFLRPTQFWRLNKYKSPILSEKLLWQTIFLKVFISKMPVNFLCQHFLNKSNENLHFLLASAGHCLSNFFFLVFRRDDKLSKR